MRKVLVCGKCGSTERARRPSRGCAACKREISRTWRKSSKNLQHYRDQLDKKLFNLFPGERDRLKQYQADHPTFKLLLNKPHHKQREAVEHRHRDGLIRGVMMGMLNRCYGHIERLYPDNTAEVLRALADFHENPPAAVALGETVYGMIGPARKKKSPKYGPSGTPEPAARKNAPTKV